MSSSIISKVVIVGGGFAGLTAAQRLARQKSVDVSIIDQRNYHLFQPLLYQVATAGLNPADIAVPIRAQFAGASNVGVHLQRVASIDLSAKKLTCEDKSIIPYDFLILACGAKDNYFGHPEWEEFAPGLKTLEQATEIRRRILSAFELAEDEENAEKREALLTFVVVGGGPTGVELAGAIADISRSVLVRDFRRINPASAKIVLIEAGERLLTSFPAPLSEHAIQDLKHLGVEIRTKTRVTLINQEGVSIGTEKIPSKSIFWAAGVQAEKIGATLGVSLDKLGRIDVKPDLSIASFPNVFVTGDLANAVINGRSVPGLAPAAIQMGKHAAENILSLIAGRPTRPFRYSDKGQIATIGKYKAVGEIGKFKLTGYIAWVSWTFVHVFSLIGFKNRGMVFCEWIWSYLFAKRGARLITNRDWRDKNS